MIEMNLFDSILHHTFEFIYYFYRKRWARSFIILLIISDILYDVFGVFDFPHLKCWEVVVGRFHKIVSGVIAYPNVADQVFWGTIAIQ